MISRLIPNPFHSPLGGSPLPIKRSRIPWLQTKQSKIKFKPTATSLTPLETNKKIKEEKTNQNLNHL